MSFLVLYTVLSLLDSYPLSSGLLNLMTLGISLVSSLHLDFLPQMNPFLARSVIRPTEAGPLIPQGLRDKQDLKGSMEHVWNWNAQQA